MKLPTGQIHYGLPGFIFIGTLLLSAYFRNEEPVVDQCIDFNKQMQKQYKDKVQFLLILGFLYYKKKENLPIALTYFESFYKEAQADSQYSVLVVQANLYIDEISAMMGIQKSIITTEHEVPALLLS